MSAAVPADVAATAGVAKEVERQLTSLAASDINAPRRWVGARHLLLAYQELLRLLGTFGGTGRVSNAKTLAAPKSLDTLAARAVAAYGAIRSARGRLGLDATSAGLLGLHTVQALERCGSFPAVSLAWRVICELLTTVTGASGTKTLQLKRLLAQTTYRAASVASALAVAGAGPCPEELLKLALMLRDFALEVATANSNDCTRDDHAKSCENAAIEALSHDQLWAGSLRCAVALPAALPRKTDEAATVAIESEAVEKCWRSALDVLQLAFRGQPPAQLAKAAAAAAAALRRDRALPSHAARVRLLLEVWELRSAAVCPSARALGATSGDLDVEQGWLSVADALLASIVGLGGDLGGLDYDIAKCVAMNALEAFGDGDHGQASAEPYGHLVERRARICMLCLQHVMSMATNDRNQNTALDNVLSVTDMARQELKWLLKFRVSHHVEAGSGACNGLFRTLGNLVRSYIALEAAQHAPQLVSADSSGICVPAEKKFSIRRGIAEVLLFGHAATLEWQALVTEPSRLVATAGDAISLCMCVASEKLRPLCQPMVRDMARSVYEEVSAQSTLAALLLHLRDVARRAADHQKEASARWTLRVLVEEIVERLGDAATNGHDGRRQLACEAARCADFLVRAHIWCDATALPRLACLAQRLAEVADEEGKEGEALPLLERTVAHHVSLRLPMAREALALVDTPGQAAGRDVLTAACEAAQRRLDHAASVIRSRSVGTSPHEVTRTLGPDGAPRVELGVTDRDHVANALARGLAALLAWPDGNARQRLHLLQAELLALEAERSRLANPALSLGTVPGNVTRRHALATTIVSAPTPCRRAPRSGSAANAVLATVVAVRELEVANCALSSFSRNSAGRGDEEAAVVATLTASCARVTIELLSSLALQEAVSIQERQALLTAAVGSLECAVSMSIAAGGMEVGRLRLLQAELTLLEPARTPCDSQGGKDADMDQGHERSFKFVDASLGFWRSRLGLEDLTDVHWNHEVLAVIRARKLSFSPASRAVALRDSLEAACMLELLGCPLHEVAALILAFACFQGTEDDAREQEKLDAAVLMHNIAATLARGASTQQLYTAEAFVEVVRGWHLAAVEAWSRLPVEACQDTGSAIAEVGTSQLELATVFPEVVQGAQHWLSRLDDCLRPPVDFARRLISVEALNASSVFILTWQEDCLETKTERNATSACTRALRMTLRALELLEGLGTDGSSARLRKSGRNDGLLLASRNIVLQLRVILQAGSLYESVGDPGKADQFYRTGLALVAAAVPSAPASVLCAWHLPLLCGRARLALAGWPLRVVTSGPIHDERIRDTSDTSSSWASCASKLLRQIQELWNDRVRGCPQVTLAYSSTSSFDSSRAGELNVHISPPSVLMELCAAVALRRARGTSHECSGITDASLKSLISWLLKPQSASYGGFGHLALALWHSKRQQSLSSSYLRDCVSRVISRVCDDRLANAVWHEGANRELNSLADLCLDLFKLERMREPSQVQIKSPHQLLEPILSQGLELLRGPSSKHRDMLRGCLNAAFPTDRVSEPRGLIGMLAHFQVSLLLSAVILRRGIRQGCGSLVRQAARRITTLASWVADDFVPALPPNLSEGRMSGHRQRQQQGRRQGHWKRKWVLWGRKRSDMLPRATRCRISDPYDRPHTPKHVHSELPQAERDARGTPSSKRSRSPTRVLPSVLMSDVQTRAEELLTVSVPLSSGLDAFFLYELQANMRGDAGVMTPSDFCDGSWLQRLPRYLSVAWLHIDLDANCVQISRLLPERESLDIDVSSATRAPLRRLLSRRIALPSQSLVGSGGVIADLTAELRDIEAARRCAEARWRDTSRADAAGTAREDAGVSARRAGFWAEARALDLRLEKVVRRVQDEVLGDWWFLLSTGHRDKHIRAEGAANFNAWLASEGISASCSAERQWMLSQLYAAAGEASTSDIARGLRAVEPSDQHEIDRLAESLASHRRASGVTASPAAAARKRARTSVDAVGVADASSTSISRREPLLLFVDPLSALLPLEACTCLAFQPVARAIAPNMALNALASASTAPARLGDSCSGYYVVDPLGDGITGRHVLSMLGEGVCQGQGEKNRISAPRAGSSTTLIADAIAPRRWRGCAGRPGPKCADVIGALAETDLFLYMGHGEHASRYLQPERVERGAPAALKLPKGSSPVPLRPLRSVVALLGCSSARICTPSILCGNAAAPGGEFCSLMTPRQVEEFEALTLPLRLLLGGCPAVLGTLWDVFAGDLDRLARQLLAEWNSREVGDACPNAPSKGVAILDALLSARRREAAACLLPNLTGASLVCYGIPV